MCIRITKLYCFHLLRLVVILTVHSIETISEWIVAFTVIGPDPNYALELPRLPDLNPDGSGAASTGYCSIGEFMKEGKPVNPKGI